VTAPVSTRRDVVRCERRVPLSHVHVGAGLRAQGEEARQARPGGTALAGTCESPGDVKEDKQTAAGDGEGTPLGSIRR